jgi:hypothetical protein
VDSYDAAVFVLFALLFGGLIAAVAGLAYLGWRVWRQGRRWWRWPALAGIGLCLMGAVIALVQAAGELR